MLALIDADTRAMLIIILGEYAGRIAHLGQFMLPAWISIRVGAFLEREPRSFSARWELLLTAFIAYLIFLAAATIVPLQPKAISGTGIVSLIPGRTTIGCYRQLTGSRVEIFICNMQLLGNILIFVPMGFLLPLVWIRRASAKSTITAALVASVSIELIQYFQQSMGMKRSVDVDDVILNLLGALIGYVLMRGLRFPPQNSG